MNTLQQKSFKILLLGDGCIDEYRYGTVDRISPEAPVPVFSERSSTSKPGMVRNVYENLINLGCDVVMVTGNQDSRKIRYVDIRSNYQMLRVDHDVFSSPISIDQVDLSCDAIVISDYSKGSITRELIDAVVKTGKPIFVDTKCPDLKIFQGCVVKINLEEYNKRISYCDNLIVTRGHQSVNHFNGSEANYYDVKKIEAFDVCGAGDTFLAALTVRYLETLDIKSAINFAIKAAGITIKHTGVYAPTRGEIDEI